MDNWLRVFSVFLSLNPSIVKANGSPAMIQHMVQRHFDAINALNPSKRESVMREAYADEVRFIDPFFAVSGQKELAVFYEKLHQTFPGYRFRTVGALEAHHGHARVHWELGPAGGPAVHTGDDFLTFENGKIHEVFVVIDGQTAHGKSAL